MALIDRYPIIEYDIEDQFTITENNTIGAANRGNVKETPSPTSLEIVIPKNKSLDSLRNLIDYAVTNNKTHITIDLDHTFEEAGIDIPYEPNKEGMVIQAEDGRDVKIVSKNIMKMYPISQFDEMNQTFGGGNGNGFIFWALNGTLNKIYCFDGKNIINFTNTYGNVHGISESVLLINTSGTNYDIFECNGSSLTKKTAASFTNVHSSRMIQEYYLKYSAFRIIIQESTIHSNYNIFYIGTLINPTTDTFLVLTALSSNKLCGFYLKGEETDNYYYSITSYKLWTAPYDTTSNQIKSRFKYFNRIPSNTCALPLRNIDAINNQDGEVWCLLDKELNSGLMCTIYLWDIYSTSQNDYLFLGGKHIYKYKLESTNSDDVVLEHTLDFDPSIITDNNDNYTLESSCKFYTNNNDDLFFVASNLEDNITKIYKRDNKDATITSSWTLLSTENIKSYPISMHPDYTRLIGTNMNKTFPLLFKILQDLAKPGGTARRYHTSIEYNGKIYMWGGQDSGATYLDTIDIYDITTDSWSSGTAGGTARSLHSANLYKGKIYFWGGSNAGGYLNTIDIYDIDNDSWSTGTTGGIARNGHRSIEYNSYIYHWGGRDAGGYLNTMERYDIENDSWSASPFSTGGTARRHHTANLYKGKIYFWGGSNGGNTLDIYNITDNIWVTGTAGGTARYLAGSTEYKGKIYIWGGGSYLNTMDIYNIESDSWSTGITGGNGRQAHKAILYNNKIYNWGGHDGSSYLNTFDIFNLKTMQWGHIAVGYWTNAPITLNRDCKFIGIEAKNESVFKGSDHSGILEELHTDSLIKHCTIKGNSGVGIYSKYLNIQNSIITNVDIGIKISENNAYGNITDNFIKANLFGINYNRIEKKRKPGGWELPITQIDNSTYINHNTIIANDGIRLPNITEWNIRNNIINSKYYAVQLTNSFNIGVTNNLLNGKLLNVNTNDNNIENIDPAFKDELNNDFKLQSKAEGYTINSKAILLGNDCRDAGCYDITRENKGETNKKTLDLSEYIVDIQYVPNKDNIQELFDYEGNLIKKERNNRQILVFKEHPAIDLEKLRKLLALSQDENSIRIYPSGDSSSDEEGIPFIIEET